MLFRAVQIAGWIGLVATALTIWEPVDVPALDEPGLFPFWPWSAIALLAAAAGFLLQRAFRGPIRGRWQLWCFVTAFAFIVAGAIRVFLPAMEVALAAGPVLLSLALVALAIEEASLDL